MARLGILTRGRFTVQEPVPLVILEAREIEVDMALEMVCDVALTVELNIDDTDPGGYAMKEFLRGNKVTLKWTLRIDGELVTTLSTATRVVFAVKHKRNDPDEDALIFIEKLHGIENEKLLLDEPSTGMVKVLLDSDDTTIDADLHHMALQVEFGDHNRLEFLYGDGFVRVLPDVIR